jgi:SAM-dependent methyltransferase
MLILARANADEAGIGNAEFLHGHIEDIPLPDGHINVVISNCVINLSADKTRVVAEAYRVLRPGGRFGVTDVIADDGLEVSVRAAAEKHVGCASGTATDYRDQLLTAGFTTATITPTHQAAPGLTSAIIQATKPAAPDGVSIRPMRADDAEQVLAIHQAGLDGGDASFETTAPTWDAFDAAKLPRHRHTAIDATTGQVLGWVAAAATAVSRPAHPALDRRGPPRREDRAARDSAARRETECHRTAREARRPRQRDRQPLQREPDPAEKTRQTDPHRFLGHQRLQPWNLHVLVTPTANAAPETDPLIGCTGEPSRA